MKTKIIEATSNEFNYGKFMLCRFTADEVDTRSAVDGGRSIIRARGWDPDRHFWVLDLQTGEGACFSKGYARADLNKHKVWVCPLFEPFLAWLYTQDLTDLDALPALVDLPHAENAMYGYRRKGPTCTCNACRFGHFDLCEVQKTCTCSHRYGHFSHCKGT